MTDSTHFPLEEGTANFLASLDAKQAAGYRKKTAIRLYTIAGAVLALSLFYTFAGLLIQRFIEGMGGITALLLSVEIWISDSWPASLTLIACISVYLSVRIADLSIYLTELAVSDLNPNEKYRLALQRYRQDFSLLSKLFIVNSCLVGVALIFTVFKVMAIGYYSPVMGATFILFLPYLAILLVVDTPLLNFLLPKELRKKIENSATKDKRKQINAELGVEFWSPDSGLSLDDYSTILLYSLCENLGKQKTLAKDLGRGKNT